MKISRLTLFISLLLLTVAGFNSCKKLTQDQLINGLWRVNTITVDTSSTNYLNLLHHFPDGNNCCTYKLDFEKDNTVIAYYIAYNDFDKIVAGNWDAIDYNNVFIQVDSFMDGNFAITRTSPKHWKLTGAQNHLKALDGTPLDTARTVIDMVKI